MCCDHYRATLGPITIACAASRLDVPLPIRGDLFLERTVWSIAEVFDTANAGLSK